MIGAKELAFQGFSRLGMGAKVCRWELTTFSGIQMFAVKGRRTIAFRHGFDRSILVDDFGDDTFAPIQTNVAIVSTGWVGGLLFFEGMESAARAGPSIRTVATLVDGIVRASASMDTKFDAGERIGLFGLGTMRGGLVLTRRSCIQTGVIKSFRTIADHLASLTSVLQDKVVVDAFASIEAVEVSAFDPIVVVLIVGLVCFGRLAVFTLVTVKAFGAIASQSWVLRVASSVVGTKQILVIVGTVRGRLVLTVLSGKAVDSVGSSGTITIVFGTGHAAMRRRRHDATAAVKTFVTAAALFHGRFAEQSSKAGRTETAHVAVNVGLAPNMLQLDFFGRIEHADDTGSIVLTIQGTIRNGPLFEFAMISLPSIVTQTRLTIQVRIVWIAVSSIDAKGVAGIVADLVKGGFAILSYIFIPAAPIDGIRTIAKELIIAKLVGEASNAFAAMITRVMIAAIASRIAAFKLVITQQSRPSRRTVAVHATPMI